MAVACVTAILSEMKLDRRNQRSRLFMVITDRDEMDKSISTSPRIFLENCSGTIYVRYGGMIV